MDLFKTFDKNKNGVLEADEVGKMNAAIFNLFPRFGFKGRNPPGAHVWKSLFTVLNVFFVNITTLYSHSIMIIFTKYEP